MMTFSLEAAKLKRSGYLPAFFGGAAAAAAFPPANMLARAETFTSLPGNPFQILLDADWQMMAMLNILTVICAACVMYHTEHADNGAQKMDVLPIRAGSMFFGKFLITALSLSGMLLLETAALAGCGLHWFPDYELDLMELAKNAGFALAAALPTVMLMLVIASACKNMWVSLGIGVILVFTLSIFPSDSLYLNLCPFRAPYQTLEAASENGGAWFFLSACAAQTVLSGMAEILYVKIRRYFS